MRRRRSFAPRALDTHPQVGVALAPIFASLDLKTLRAPQRGGRRRRRGRAPRRAALSFVAGAVVTANEARPRAVDDLLHRRRRAARGLLNQRRTASRMGSRCSLWRAPWPDAAAIVSSLAALFVLSFPAPEKPPRFRGDPRWRRAILRLPHGRRHFAEMLSRSARSPPPRTSLGPAFWILAAAALARHAGGGAARPPAAWRPARCWPAPLAAGFALLAGQGAFGNLAIAREYAVHRAEFIAQFWRHLAARRRRRRLRACLLRAAYGARASPRLHARVCFREPRHRADDPLHRTVRRADRAAFGLERALPFGSSERDRGHRPRAGDHRARRSIRWRRWCAVS